MTDDKGIVAAALRLDRRDDRLLRAAEFGDRVEVPIRRRDAVDLHRDAGRGQRLQPISPPRDQADSEAPAAGEKERRR